MTYSIVARDSRSGRFGVAVQSRYLSVGSVVPWLEAGLGAIATQGLAADLSFGPIGLELLRAGRTADQVVASLIASDAQSDKRQVSVVDASGRAATHSGRLCAAASGHQIGDGYSVQGNFLKRETCWSTMARAYESALADDLPFSECLLRTLDAAEGEGGDLRGRQSAAIAIAAGEVQPAPWRGMTMNLRVEDHPDPLGELRRIVALYEARELLGEVHHR